jgi:poly(A) polymerase
MTQQESNGEVKSSPFKYDAALKVLRTLRQRDYEALLAGGCVRDILTRRRPQDYDIVTNARPEQVKELFERTIPVGEKFGVIIVFAGGVPFEVATFRQEEDYEDGRHPKTIRYAGAREDAIRRDFTINGMFYDPIEGKVLDYVGGQEDLGKKIIRAIGDPEKRFNEDYLRLLRAVRFATTLGFTIESFTKKAIIANAGKIAEISQERIREELEKILVSRNRRKGLELLDDLGLLGVILPEVAAGKGVEQGKKLHPEGDVWQHTLLAMSHVEQPSFVMAMAVMLHDVGKPVTAAESDDSERPFLNHERVGEQIARKIAERLRLSNKETEEIAFLVRHHMMLKDVARMRKSTFKRLLAHEYFKELLELHRIDAVASSGDLSNYEIAREGRKRFSEEEIKPEPFVKGDDLASIGIERGPAMGKILRQLYTAQLDEEIKSRDEAISLAKKLHAAATAGGAPNNADAGA